jgi:L-lactate dehydrogenase complex protein LldG
MATSRDTILNKLRAAQTAQHTPEPITSYLPMVPLADTSTSGLRACFISQAERSGSQVYQATSEEEAVSSILGLIGSDPCVLGWPFDRIGLPGLADALKVHSIAIAKPNDASMRVGITGVDAALAATGSLVLATGQGQHRVTSLLPPVHIAVVRASQIIPDLESWVAAQRAQSIDAFRRTSSVIVISGPSRTADIAMQLSMGMHGPEQVHIILI